MISLRPRWPRLLLVLPVVLLAAGCHSSGQSVTRSRTAEEIPAGEARPGNGAARSAPTAGEAGSDYRIQPSDIVEVTVFQEPDLKSTLRVSSEGTIAFPLIGVVPVAGLPPQLAANGIRDRLAKGYLVNPQVSVTVMEFAKRRFTVLGEVQKPGSYDLPVQQEVTVLQAIGMAGGYTRIANPSKVTLMRNADGKSTTIELNAKRMARGNEESAAIVQPGDVITVAESRF
jgi:polysaccharide export outer membrane protein